MKQAPIALRKNPPAAPTAKPASSPPLPEVNAARLAELLQAPALGEASAPAPEGPAAAKGAGRQRRDSPKRRADRDEGELERLQVHLSADVARALRVLAATEGRSLSAVVEAELRGLLRRKGAL